MSPSVKSGHRESGAQNIEPSELKIARSMCLKQRCGLGARLSASAKICSLGRGDRAVGQGASTGEGAKRPESALGHLQTIPCGMFGLERLLPNHRIRGCGKRKFTQVLLHDIDPHQRVHHQHKLDVISSTAAHLRVAEFAPSSAAVYQLGQYGTAAKKLKEWQFRPRGSRKVRLPSSPVKGVLIEMEALYAGTNLPSRHRPDAANGGRSC